MQSNFKILSALYGLINQPQVKDLVGGGIYKSGTPKTLTKESVEINILTSLEGYLQQGYANVNIYVPSRVNGLPNTRRMEQIAEVVQPLILDAQKGNYRFQIESQSGPLADIERDNIYFYNFKLTYQKI